MKTIRELRENRKWSQADLAAKIDVAPSTIYNWERGRFDPRASQLRRLAHVFGVSMDDIALTDEEGKAAPVAA